MSFFQSFDHWLCRLAARPIAVPLFLLFITVLAHGLLTPWLGYYSDDWLFIWTGQKLGSAGITRYFTTNRPVWGLFFQVTMPLLGSHPLAWHLFGLFIRWVSALACWWMLSLAAPRESRRVALWTALLLLVYPGFKLTPVPITFGHLFLVMAIFFASLAFTLLVERRPDRFFPFTAAALLFSALNLLAMEYFFMLELVRPLLILLANAGLPLRPRLLHALKRWLPYLALFLTVLIWRMFFFPYQTENYSYSFFEQFQTAPLPALVELVQMFFRDLFVALIVGWGNIFTELPLRESSTAIRALYALLALAGGLACFACLRALRHGSASLHAPATWWVLALVWLSLAGLPFLLTGIKVQAVWIYSRFTIPYILGAALVIALLLSSFNLKTWVSLVILGSIAGLSIGSHFLNANQFRNDWEQQKELFWQMVWRFPDLRPGTTLVINEQHSYAGSNTYLTAALNWLYAPENHTARMTYNVTYARYINNILLQSDQAGPLRSGLPSSVFEGSRGDVLALFYTGRCLLTLDPDIDPANPTLDVDSARSAHLSRPEQILLDPAAGPVKPDPMFEPEPPRGWCYWYQQADLARQRADWAEVVRIG
ncbi:MAG: hypothetical protein EHM21_10970, partial [Chloroflexi bacterium]